MPSARRPAAPARSGVLRWFLIGLLVLLLAAGAGLAWFWVGSDALARSRAREAMTTFAGDPAAAPDTGDKARATPGAVIGVMVIPRLGLTWPIVSGTHDLDRGLGWSPDTTWPGVPGNTVVSGLRLTGGSPLRHVQDLRVGDRIEVHLGGTKRALVYEIKVASLTVDKDDSWVLDPVPGHPDTEPTDSLLTLITSQDLLASRERSVAFAVLVDPAPTGH